MGLDEVLDALKTARVYELGLPLEAATPHLPNHPPFMHRLIRRHGDVDFGEGVSAAADFLTMGLHLGTHLDALGHISKNGALYSGVAAAEAQSEERLLQLSIDETPPILRRGVLLDVAGLRGVPALGPREEITTEDLEGCLARQGVALQPGDAVLLRSGWASLLGDAERYVGHASGAPGPGVASARWLVERGISLTGSDTPAYERMPTSGVPVHVELLVRHGIQIMECLDLESLAQDAVSVFLLIVLPLRLVGATASPIRPIALVL